MDRLFKAVKKGDTQKVAQLLQDANLDINSLDPKTGKLALQIAMENGEDEIFKMLTRYEGIDLNASSKDGQTVIETAILVNSVDYVDEILRRNINTKKKNSKGESAMCVAIRNNINTEIIKKFIHYNFDINEKVAHYGSLLNLAIASNQFESFKCLLDEPKIKMRVVDDEENTSLLLATKMKRGDFIMAIFEKLSGNCLSEMDKQFYVNAQDQDGNTALHVAAMKDYQTIMDILMKEGSRFGLDLDLKNKAGKKYDFYVSQRKRQTIMEAQNEKRRLEEKRIKNREKEEEKIRVAKEQERLRAEERRKKKEQQALLAQQIGQKKKLQKSRTIWMCGILFIAVLGAMYLLILSAIPAKSSSF